MKEEKNSGNNQIDLQAILNEYKKLELQLKTQLPKEEFRKLVRPIKAKPEKSALFEEVRKEVSEFLKKLTQEKVQKLFTETITEDKPEGQKWIIFSVPGNYSIGIVRSTKKS